MFWIGKGVLKIGSKTYRKGDHIPDERAKEVMCPKAREGLIDKLPSAVFAPEKKKSKKKKDKGD